jgi:methionine-rich copper-binding protein CopC
VTRTDYLPPNFLEASMQVRHLFAAGFLTLSMGAATVAFHTHLTKAEPAVDGTIRETPKQVRLWFSERPEVALSGATLMTETHAPVAVVKLAATDDTMSVAGTVPVALKPGKYMVMWKTGSGDGHVVRGMYYFTYDPAAAPAPAP